MDPALRPRRAADTVMASIDGGATDERLIIADVSRDDAWIAMSMDDAPALTSRR